MQKQILPQIFVVPDCLFNDGRGQQGFWIDASLPASEMRRQIKAMMRLYCEDGCQYWSIKEWRGFYNLKIDPRYSLEDIAEMAQVLRIHGKAYAVYIKFFDGDRVTLQDFDRQYQGVWDSKADFLAHLKREFSRGEFDEYLPEHLADVCWHQLVQEFYKEHFVGFPSGVRAYHVFYLY